MATKGTRDQKVSISPFGNQIRLQSSICRLQEARLEVLEKVIRKRQNENDEIQNERLDRIWQRKLQERDTVLQKIQKKKVKALRKLAEKRNKVENKVEKRDIIADYANFGSSVYAPKARDGSFRDKASTTLQITLNELNDFDGMF